MNEVTDLMSWLEGLDKKTAAQVAKQSTPGGLGQPAVQATATLPGSGSYTDKLTQQALASAPNKTMGGVPQAAPSGGVFSNVTPGGLAKGVGGTIAISALQNILFDQAAKEAKNQQESGYVPQYIPQRDLWNNSGKPAPVGDKVASQSLSDLVTGGAPAGGERAPSETPPDYYIPDELKSELGLSDSPAKAQFAGAKSTDFNPNKGRGYTPVSEDFSSMLVPSAAPYADVNPVDYSPAGPNGESTAQVAAPAQVAPQEDQLMKMIDEILAAKGPVQEEPNPKTVADIDNLTKERTGVMPEEPKTALGKFGRGISKLVTNLSAPGGSYDPTRYDTLQKNLVEAKQKFTPQEALRGELAVKDTEGRQQFNRQSVLQNSSTGGLTESDKQRAGVMLNSSERAAGRDAKKQDRDLELRNKIAEIQATANAGKLNPEAAQRAVIYSLIEKYPDIFKDYLPAATGMKGDPVGLAALMASRGVNPMVQATADIVNRRAQAMETNKKGTKTGAALKVDEKK